jgi:hypothetical protein
MLTRIFLGTVGQGSGEGIQVRLVVHQPIQAATEAEPHSVAVPVGAAFRVAPLLLVVDAPASPDTTPATYSADGDSDGGAGGPTATRSVIAVGDVRFVVTAAGPPEVHVVVGALWTRQPSGWEPVSQLDQLPGLVESELKGISQGLRGGPETVATALAKGVSEHSRNAVARIRELRLQVEAALGRGLRRVESRGQEGTLSDLVEVVLAINRARDYAREAVREGLWTWRTAPAEYHAQRRTMDDTLPKRPGERRARRSSWMVTLDAAVRQCRELERQLNEEIAHCETLMRLVSTVAASRDARAQETFNLIAAVGGIALGLPALVLSLYGADSILPLAPSDWRVFTPLTAGAILAALVAAMLPGAGLRIRALRLLVTVTWTLIVLLVLAVAGFLVVPHHR